MTTRSEQRPQLLYSASSGDGAQNGSSKQERLGHSSPEGESDPLTSTATPHNTATTPTPPSTTTGNTEGECASESKGDDEAGGSGGGDGGGGGTSENSKPSAASTPAAPPSSGLQHHFFLEQPRPQLDKLDSQAQLLQVQQQQQPSRSALSCSAAVRS